MVDSTPTKNELIELGRVYAEARQAHRTAALALRAGVQGAIQAGYAEAAVARVVGVDRSTVRKWIGK